MKYRKTAGIICICAWLICSSIIAAPIWSTLYAQDLKEESDVEIESLSIKIYEPPDTTLGTAGNPKDSDGVGIKTDSNVISDSIPVFTRKDSLFYKEGLPKKKFVGTSRDIGIAFATLIGWLAVMWLAANQRN